MNLHVWYFKPMTAEVVQLQPLFAGALCEGLHKADNADWSWDGCAPIWTHLRCAGRVLSVQGLHHQGHSMCRLNHQSCRCWQLPGGTGCQKTATGCNQWGSHGQPPAGAGTEASWRRTCSLHDMCTSGAHSATYGHPDSQTTTHSRQQKIHRLPGQYIWLWESEVKVCLTHHSMIHAITKMVHC